MDTKDIGFCYVLVRDADLERTIQHVGVVLECARGCGGDVVSFDISIVLVSFGMLEGESEGAAQRKAFVAALSRTIGPDVAYVHGRRRALVGSIGTEHRRSFTFLFEGLRRCFAELVDVPFGAGREI